MHNKNAPFFQIPHDMCIREQWLQFLQEICDVTKITDYTVLCIKHFEQQEIDTSSKYCRLKKGSIPSIFNFTNSQNFNKSCPASDLNYEMVSQSSSSSEQLTTLQAQCNVLTQQLQNTTEKYEKCLTELRDIQKYVKNHLPSFESLKKIIDDADNSNEEAVFLMDCIQNYNKNNPKWSELTVRMCTVWRFCSPKGYEFCRRNLTALPFLKYNKTCNQLILLVRPSLQQNPLFSCPLHKPELCTIIIRTVAKPVIDNICLELTDSVKRKFVCNKPLSRKVLKL